MNVTDKITITNEDNMQLMARYPDKYFDLAIVDPPYGIARFGNRVELSNRLCKSAKLNEWDIKPNEEYFKELFRISKFQIIWGANNFILPSTEYFLIWNKKQTVENFASAEYAWTNVKKPAQVFDYSIHKTMSDRKEEGGKIHPTQKPVALYKWILDKYAKDVKCTYCNNGRVIDDDYDRSTIPCELCNGTMKIKPKILDTHLGSGSIAIACHDYGFELTACELDSEYYEKAIQRIKNHTNQQKLF
jgi:site-specific DNA-methyltransferase (adenine-specific)